MKVVVVGDLSPADLEELPPGPAVILCGTQEETREAAAFLYRDVRLVQKLVDPDGAGGVDEEDRAFKAAWEESAGPEMPKMSLDTEGQDAQTQAEAGDAAEPRTGRPAGSRALTRGVPGAPSPRGETPRRQPCS